MSRVADRNEQEEDTKDAERVLFKRGLKRIDAQLADEEERFNHEATQRQHRVMDWLQTYILVGPVLLLYHCPNVLFFFAVALNIMVFAVVPFMHVTFIQTWSLRLLCLVVSLLSAVISGAKAGNVAVRERHQHRIRDLKAERERLMDKVLDDTL